MELNCKTNDNSSAASLYKSNTPPYMILFCNNNSLKVERDKPRKPVSKLLNKSTSNSPHFDSLVNVGELVGCADGVEVGWLVGNFVGRCVRLTPLIKGADVVGTEVEGIEVG